MLSAIFRRLQKDFSLRDFSREYEAVLLAARDNGYRIVALEQFYSLISDNALEDCRTLALRHDVDINLVAGNEKFYRIEKNCGAVSTFYFRLKTFPAHSRLIRKLLADGFEVGYHFEEPAAFAIKHGIASTAELMKAKGVIQDQIKSNVAMVRRKYNKALKSISSHGDWINRKLGIVNHAFIDPNLLAECSLLFEAYGSPVKTTAAIYISDVIVGCGRWAGGASPGEAFTEGKSPIYMLTHEGQWFRGILAKNLHVVGRILEGISYALRRRRTLGSECI